MNNIDNIKKWLWLTIKCKISRKKIKGLLETFETIDKIYDAQSSAFDMFHFLSAEEKSILCNKSMQGINDFIKTLSDNNVKIVTIDNIEEYPLLLRQTYDYPYVLYCRGKFLKLNDYVCVAMVGARRASPYGINVAKTLAHDISKSGIIVVSGMAEGIDSASHIGALDAGCPTVAVLGCGINRVYPASNASLMKRIMQTGMVISEYPPNTEPLKHHFPERNRIISGICHGTVVVEANFNSGSLITAGIAGETNRDVFAVPGNINSLYSKGTNYLIKDGAYVVTSSDDILNQYSQELENINIIKNANAQQNSLTNKKSNASDSTLSYEEQLVLSSLGAEPMHVDKLLSITDLDFSKLSEALLSLELSGKIYSQAGNLYTLSI